MPIVTKSASEPYRPASKQPPPPSCSHTRPAPRSSSPSPSPSTDRLFNYRITDDTTGATLSIGQVQTPLRSRPSAHR
jgi:hypothetical protein